MWPHGSCSTPGQEKTAQLREGKSIEATSGRNGLETHVLEAPRRVCALAEYVGAKASRVPMPLHRYEVIPGAATEILRQDEQSKRFGHVCPPPKCVWMSPIRSTIAIPRCPLRREIAVQTSIEPSGDHFA
jgi:hypothetical protein